MDITLDSVTGDLVFDGSDLSTITSTDEVVQLLRSRLRMFYGEWFLDNRRGVAYYQQILKKNIDANAVDSIFKATILGTPGVNKLLEFDLVLDAITRVLTLTFKAEATDGIIEFEEVIP